MTTETTETLRKKANDAVATALGYSSYDCARVWSAWNEGTMSQDDFSPVAEDPDRVLEITEAVLEALGFDALMEEREALRDALEWYGVQAMQMGEAALQHDRKTMLSLMEDVATDFGKRARVAMRYLK